MKGFTLIELLAVIVILAIILLIAVPVINNIIDGAKKSAFESSVKNIIKSGEYTYASNLFNPNRELVYTFEDGEVTGNFPEAKLEFMGEVPESGNLIVRADGKIAASLYNGDYCATKDYNSSKVTIVDKTKEDCYSAISLPEIILNGITPMNVEINTTYSDLGVVAKTIAGEDITEIETKILKDNIEVPSIDTATKGTYRIIYTVYEGSKTNYIEREINVVDTIKPVITYESTTNLLINEVDTFNLLDGISVSDNSLETLSINVTGNIARIAGSYVITYSATDSSGNIEEVVRIINVNDVEAPVITLNGNSVINLNVGDIYTELNATSLDDADGDLTSSIVKTGSVNTNIPGTYFITYTSTDSSNNESNITRTINVIDNIAPVINLLGGSIVTLELGTQYTEFGISAIDNADGDISSNVEITGTVNNSIAGVYVLNYSVKDSSDNRSAILTRTVIVESSADASRPYIELKAPTGVSAVNLNLDITLQLYRLQVGINYAIKYQIGTNPVQTVPGGFNATSIIEEISRNFDLSGVGTAAYNVSIWIEGNSKISNKVIKQINKTSQYTYQKYSIDFDRTEWRYSSGTLNLWSEYYSDYCGSDQRYKTNIGLGYSISNPPHFSNKVTLTSPLLASNFDIYYNYPNAILSISKQSDRFIMNEVVGINKYPVTNGIKDGYNATCGWYWHTEGVLVTARTAYIYKQGSSYYGLEYTNYSVPEGIRDDDYWWKLIDID